MKVQKTFTISDNVYEEFDKIAKEKSINKSLFIENCLKKYIEKNKKI